jgi:hypothetical protein
MRPTQECQSQIEILLLKLNTNVIADAQFVPSANQCELDSGEVLQQSRRDLEFGRTNIVRPLFDA